MNRASFCAAHPDVHADVQRLFPAFDYHERGGHELDFRKPGNVVGHQQRAVTCYWGIECGGPIDLGLDLGSHRGLTPFAIHVDRWYDNKEAHPIYGGVAPADLVGDASGAVLDALPDGAFPFVVSNHSLEHMPGPDSAIVDTLSRWLRKLRVGGALALVIPDNDRFDVLKSDVDHKSAWGASDFMPRVLQPLLDRGGVHVSEFNTLANSFSFNVVLRRAV